MVNYGVVSWHWFRYIVSCLIWLVTVPFPPSPIAWHPLLGQGPLLVETSPSHSIRHSTLGRTPLDEWSAHHRDLYLTTHNTYYRQTPMPPAGFKPAIPPSKWPQIHTLDRTAIGISYIVIILLVNWLIAQPLKTLYIFQYFCWNQYRLPPGWLCSRQTRAESWRSWTESCRWAASIH